MDLVLSEEQELLQQTAREFVAGHRLRVGGVFTQH